ncbi:MAG: pitrilysin family protein [Sandaracinaceae bacterium]
MRSSRFASLLALGALAAATSPALATETQPSAPERYSLDNGIDVALDPIPGRRTVAVVVSVDAGRRDQPEGWSGLAHLTEHLLYQGTTAAPGEFLSRLERLGASGFNGQTGDDWTRYYEVVPSSRLEQALWLEAERFAHGVDDLHEAGVEEQRRVLDRERELRTHFGREEVWELVQEILYPAGHPYSHSRERRDDVHAAHVRAVRWFFQRYYGPDMLTVSLSGGFDPSEARRWIARYFGPLRRSGLAPPPAWDVPAEVDLGGERRVVAEANRATDALYVIWPTPPWGTAPDAALDFVAAHLERALTERLVRSDQAIEVDVSQISRALASHFMIQITVPHRAGTLTPLRAVDAELRALRGGGIEAERVERIRRRWRAEEVRTMDASLTRALRHAERVPSFAGGRYELAANLARYDAVTAADVHAAAVRHLHTRRRLVVSLSSRSNAPPEGRIVRDIMYEGESP